MESLELTIIQHLLYNEEYFNKVIPYVSRDLFLDDACQTVIYTILKLYKEHQNKPTAELVIPKLLEYKCSQDKAKKIQDIVRAIKNPPAKQNLAVLVDTTQDYFRKNKTNQVLSTLLEKAGNNYNIALSDVTDLRDAVSFAIEEKPYYDYLQTRLERFVSYGKKEEKFHFPLESLDTCTNGGMQRKSLSVVMASTGGGKSIFLCNAAAHSIKEGNNVLYITCEMSVEEIAKRIDSNLLDATQDALTNGAVAVSTLEERLNKDEIAKWGHLYIKEYPAGFATSLNIQQNLEEIERERGIKIDILIVDYLNLMATSRYSTKNANTYTIVKAIAEELRGIGQELDIPVLTATQSNRSALSKENRVDGGLETVSDSIGLPQTADFMFNIIDVPDPAWKQNRWRLLKILKNRWGDPSKEYIKVQLDTSHARFSDLSNGILEEKPSFAELELTKKDSPDKVKKKDEPASGTDQTVAPAMNKADIVNSLF